MGKVVEHKEYWMCDRCARRSERHVDGSGALDLKATYTYVGLGGDLGGGSANHYLCGMCMEEFKKFLSNQDVIARVQYAKETTDA